MGVGAGGGAACEREKEKDREPDGGWVGAGCKVVAPGEGQRALCGCALASADTTALGRRARAHEEKKEARPIRGGARARPLSPTHTTHSPTITMATAQQAGGAELAELLRRVSTGAFIFL